MNRIIFSAVLFLITVLVMGCSSVPPTTKDIYLTNVSPVSRPKSFSFGDQFPRNYPQLNVSFRISNMTNAYLHFFDGSFVEMGQSIVIKGRDKVLNFLSVLENGNCEGENNSYLDSDKLYLEAKVTSCE